jgi:hypothetical protein
MFTVSSVITESITAAGAITVKAGKCAFYKAFKSIYSRGIIQIPANFLPEIINKWLNLFTSYS